MKARPENDLAFRIRPTAERRDRTSFAPLPRHVVLYADGSAVVAHADGKTLTRYESIGECLSAHGLMAGDLDPIDDE